MNTKFTSNHTEEEFIINNLTQELRKMEFDIQFPPIFSRSFPLIQRKKTEENAKSSLFLEEPSRFFEFVRLFLSVRSAIKKFKELMLRKNQRIHKIKQFSLNDEVFNFTMENPAKTDKKRDPCWVILLKFFNFFCRFLPLIPLNSQFLNLWQFLRKLLTLYYFSIIPLDMAFCDNYADFFRSFQLFLNIFAIIFFFLDFFVKTNTEIFRNHQNIAKKAEILKHFFEESFLLDVFAIIPLALNFAKIAGFEENFAVYLCKGLFFLRARDFGSIFSKKPFFHTFSEKICAFLLFSHICACFWYKLSETSDNFFENSWISCNELTKSSFFEKYLSSYLFILETLAFQSQNSRQIENSCEKVFRIILILLWICAIYCGFLKKIPENQHFLDDSQEVLTKYFKQFPQKSEIQDAVRNEIAEKSEKSRFFSFEARLAELKKSLPEALLQRLLELDELQILKKMRIFKDFSAKTQVKCAALLKKHEFSAGEALFSAQNREICVFFVKTGKIGLTFCRKPGKCLILKGKRALLQEKELFTGFFPRMGAVSLEKSEVYSLKREDFLEILKESRADYEKFCEIRDKLMFSSEFLRLAPGFCAICRENRHDEANCPVIHYISSRKPINSANYRRNSSQKRASFQRKSGKKRTILNNNKEFLKESEESLEEGVFSEDNANFSAVFEDSLAENFENVLQNENEHYFPQDNLEVILREYNENKVKKLEYLLKT